MKNKIFLSFSETDRDIVTRIAKHAMDPSYESLNFRVAPFYERWQTKSISVIQNVVAKALKDTNRTIVLVGEDTHESIWVEVEVDMSIELNNSVYAMRLNNTNGEIPKCLKDRDIKVENWDIEVLQFLAIKSK